MKRQKEIDQRQLFELIQRHPGWSAAQLSEALGSGASPAAVRRYLKRYLKRGDLREVFEIEPGPRRPLNEQFLIGVLTDQNIYRAATSGDFPPGATYSDQESLTAQLLEDLTGEDLLVHDAMLVLGAEFDILLFISSRGGISDLAPMVTSKLRRYRGVRNTITMSVGTWHRR